MRTLATLFLLALAAPALAVPLQLTHQGHLADSAGVPLEGAQDLTVSLYDAPAGGVLLWSDTVAANLEGGNFAIVLGANSANPLPADALDGSVRYVGLTVGLGAELPQRLPLTSVPYAVRAGVARDVAGGIVDASEIRINGTTVITTEGAVSAPVSFNDLTDVPDDADALGALSCTIGQIAIFNGLDWACGAQAPTSVDTSTLTGTINIQNLPVGGGSSEVAAGDHAHSFGQITGQAALSQLPTGTGPNEVALGDHGHNLVDLGGDLPIARVTGTVPFAQLPTGSGANQVAAGNHAHAFSAITGSAVLAQLPVGTSATTVSRGDHNHVLASLTGDLPMARVTGTFDAGRLTGTVPNAALPSAFLRSEAVAAMKAGTVHGLNGRYFKLYGLEITTNSNAAHVGAPHLNMTATRGNHIGSASFEMVGAPHCGYCYSGGPKAVIYQNGNVPYTFYTSGGEVYVDLGEVNSLQIRSSEPISPAVVSALPDVRTLVVKMN